MNFYIADTHFGHNAVLKYDKRPFQTIEEMETLMVKSWNKAVRTSDTVYILGDFCWQGAEEWLRLVKKLNGKKVLLKGNHDLKHFPEELQNKFIGIYDYLEVDDQGRKVILSHYPILFYRRSNNPKYYMLCGHVHITAENDWLEKWTKELQEAYTNDSDVAHAVHTGQIYNVGCMMPWMAYTPRTLDEILAFLQV